MALQTGATYMPDARADGRRRGQRELLGVAQDRADGLLGTAAIGSIGGLLARRAARLLGQRHAGEPPLRRHRHPAAVAAAGAARLAESVAAEHRRPEPARPRQPARVGRAEVRCSTARSPAGPATSRSLWGTPIYDPQGQRSCGATATRRTAPRSCGATSMTARDPNAEHVRSRRECIGCAPRSRLDVLVAVVVRRALGVVPSLGVDAVRTPHPLAWLAAGAASRSLTGSFRLTVRVGVGDASRSTTPSSSRSALLFGPAPATLAIALARRCVFSLRRRQPARQLAFNTAALALSMWCARGAFFALAGVEPLGDRRRADRAAGPAAARADGRLLRR